MWEQYGARGEGLAIYTNKEAVLNALPSELQDNLVLGWGEMFYAFNLAEAAQLWDDAYLPESLIRIKSSRFKNEQEFRFLCAQINPQSTSTSHSIPKLLKQSFSGLGCRMTNVREFILNC
jgi:hypothetical protein